MNERTNFYILDRNFDTLDYLERYQSLLWVDRYNECGDFEICCSPTEENLKYLVMDNYIWSSSSDTLMIVEKIEYQSSTENGLLMIVKGRDLRCILERRILYMKTKFNKNLEDSIKQILDYSIINPSDEKRKISNFIFEYSHDSRINSLTIDEEFEEGANLLEVIKTMCQAKQIGFKITTNNAKQFVFKLYIGEDRSYDQFENPWIIFSPQHNNLISSSFKFDKGENYANMVYCVDNDGNTKELSTGQTGLMRKEFYNRASVSKEDDETQSDYIARFIQDGKNVLYDKMIQRESEAKIEPRMHSEYGKDYFIGDIVQSENEFGFEERLRITEFITSYQTSGFDMYPTLTEVPAIDEVEVSA